MNNVTPERKQNLMKSLAIIGIMVIIISVAWLSVQIIKVFPTALNSLASLADSVYNYNPRQVEPIKLQPQALAIDSGKTLTINWNQPLKTGTYAFKYECSEGVSIDLKNSDGNFKSIECGKSYDIGAVNTTEVMIASEKKAELEVNYSVAYFKTNAAEITSESMQWVLVKNARLSEVAEAPVIEATEEVKEPEVVETPEEVVSVTPPVVVTTPKPNTTPVVTPTPKPVTPTYTYAIPVSDPNGFTDLKVSYVGIGRVDNYGNFVNTGLLYKNVAGAIQFSVINNGTKTSETWSFTTKLPGKLDFESNSQIVLKPNEKATLTIAFPAVTNTELQTFSMNVTTRTDINNTNNSVNWSTVVIN
jgi:hypothetical protein